INATSASHVASLGIGVSGAVANGMGTSGSLAIAGGAAINSIDNEVAAYIEDNGLVPSRTIRAGGTGVFVTAQDNSEITADAGGFAISFSNSKSGSAISGSAGAGIAVNEIGQHSGQSVKAYIDPADVKANAGDVVISATSSPTINALSMAGSLAAAR